MGDYNHVVVNVENLAYIYSTFSGEMNVMLRKIPITAVTTLGRPRKLTHARIIAAAVEVLDEDGYRALTMRGLAQRLGVNHATLYNYVGHIEDVESEALESLMALVPIPDRQHPAPMRQQLIEHLLALRELQFQHPHVLHAPIGSPTWRSHVKITNRVLRAIKPGAQSLTQTVLAYNALTALMAGNAERARASGVGDYAKFIQAQRRAVQTVPKADSELFHRLLSKQLPGPDVDSLTEVLNYLIDRLLPMLGRSKK